MEQHSKEYQFWLDLVQEWEENREKNMQTNTNDITWHKAKEAEQLLKPTGELGLVSEWCMVMVEDIQYPIEGYYLFEEKRWGTSKKDPTQTKKVTHFARINLPEKQGV